MFVLSDFAKFLSFDAFTLRVEGGPGMGQRYYKLFTGLKTKQTQKRRDKFHKPINFVFSGQL